MQKIKHKRDVHICFTRFCECEYADINFNVNFDEYACWMDKSVGTDNLFCKILCIFT